MPNGTGPVLFLAYKWPSLEITFRKFRQRRRQTELPFHLTTRKLGGIKLRDNIVPLVENSFLVFCVNSITFTQGHLLFRSGIYYLDWVEFNSCGLMDLPSV